MAKSKEEEGKKKFSVVESKKKTKKKTWKQSLQERKKDLKPLGFFIFQYSILIWLQQLSL